MASSSVQTFGVELELLVFYTTYSRPLPAEEIRRYGPVIKCPFCTDIVLPPGIAPKYPNFDKLPGAWVRQKVADVISEAGFKARSSWRAKGHEPDLFDYWNVVPDISLKINEDFEFAYSPLQAVGVEINSPVLVAGEEAFNEVLTVVKAINSAFRTAVPPMCGLHIHVGRDREALTLRTVQRSASLLWLAGNLIETLHPRSRLNNRHCLGIEKCNLSTGMTAKEAAGDWKLGKRQHVKLSLDRVDKDRKKPTHYQYTPPATLPNYPDSTLSLAVAREHGFRFEEPEHREIPDVLDGVRSILRATDTGTIAELTGSTAHRGAYNFGNMARRAGEIPEGWIMPPWKTPDGEVIPSGWEDCPVEGEPDTAIPRHSNKVIREAPRKPTIEFRQGAGSLDAEWIVIWAKICLALTGPAVVESSNDDFFQLLYNCVKAKEQPSEYDVFDLLHDIGISKEDLDAVHHRLATGRHEQEPALVFHRLDDLSGALDEGLEPGWQLGPQAVSFGWTTSGSDDQPNSSGSDDGWPQRDGEWGDEWSQSPGWSPSSTSDWDHMSAEERGWPPAPVEEKCRDDSRKDKAAEVAREWEPAQNDTSGTW